MKTKSPKAKGTTKKDEVDDNKKTKDTVKINIPAKSTEDTNEAEKLLYPDVLAGVKRGKPMTFEEADGKKPNPKYSLDEGYRKNCQTCVVAYEARLRGYNVEAKPNFKGSLSELLSSATNRAWLDPKTGRHPEYIEPRYDSDINTPAKYIKYLEETLEKDVRYTMQFGWKGRKRIGHIVHIQKSDAGLEIYDPQVGATCKDVKNYLKRIKFKISIRGQSVSFAPRLLKVERYGFNPDVVNEVLIKAGGNGDEN